MEKKKPALVFSLVMTAFLLCSCGTGQRKIASSNLPPKDLGQDVHAAYIYVSGPEFTSETCVSYLRDMYRKINYGHAWNYDRDKLWKDFKTINQELWGIRLALHQKLPSVSRDCALEMKSAFRALRAVEDYLGEKYYDQVPLQPGDIAFDEQRVPILDRQAYPPYFVAPGLEHGKFKFQSGDIMITRGVSYLSAMIARLGDIRSQFSHVVLVNVEGGEGGARPSTRTIESYIGVGVQIYELEKALKNENARIIVLRPKDQELGKSASDFMYQLAKKRIDAGNPIPYDYKMDFKDHTALSCAEVGEFAYEQASQGSFLIPRYPSKVSLNNEDFLRRIGQKNGELFSPGDLEIDPRFDLVLEWRDYRLIRDSRYKDAILSQMYVWMDKYGYKLRDDATSWFAEHLIWPSRRTFLWPLVSKLTGIPDFSPELSRETFGTLALLNQIGEILLNELMRQDAAFEKAHGWPLSNQELEISLENLRTFDLNQFRLGNRTLFHFGFRPDHPSNN